MYIHIFGFKWKPGTTEAQKTHAAHDINAFRGKIPGLLDVHTGHNQSERSQGFEFVGLMRFKGKEAYEAYVKHPQHQALLKWLKPLIDPVEMDFLAMD
jgi:antibiotic biosynthesis monooxygenase (ABM) superfamily enzyme